jgi:predicted P-loop ATPase
MLPHQFLQHFPKHLIVTPKEGSKDGWFNVVRTLPKEQESGRAVFFTPNGFEKLSREEIEVTQFNSVYIDIDCPKVNGENQSAEIVEDFIKKKIGEVFTTLEPSFIVRTKNGAHFHFLLKEPLAVTEETKRNYIYVMDSMVKHFNADVGAKGINRVLRVPGYKHYKDVADPYDVYLNYEDPNVKYELSQVAEAIGISYPAPAKVELNAIAGTFTDDTEKRLEKMLKLDNVRKLYEGDVSHYDGDHSRADSALCCHLAFWFEKDPTVIEQIWLRSPLGQREKTQSRTDYRSQTIMRAIGVTTDVYQPKKEIMVIKDCEEEDTFSWDSLMSITKNKGTDKEYEEYIANDENIIRILNHYKVAKYDDFTSHSYLYINGKWITRDDGSDGRLYSWLVDKFPFLAKVTVKKIAELITFVQYRNRFDSAQDYVNSLTWDGVGRLDTWLPKVFFVEEDSYYRDIGSKWFMGIVARILQPGCKFDNALVVHGGQSIGKSSVFLIIAGEESHVEFTDLKVREMQQDIQGKLVVEFAEAAIFSKADSESLKSIISRQTDTFRVPYERHPRDFPRRCVFAVTANNDDILKDATGGRRWWAVEVPPDMRVYPPQRKADIYWLRDNRDQLFAEAAVRFRNGEDFRTVDEFELIKHQKSITATEQDEDLFFNWYYGLGANHQNKGVTIREAYCGSYKEDRMGDKLREDVVSINKADEMRVARILKKLGLEKKHLQERNIWVPGQMFDRNFKIKFKTTIHEKGQDW